MAAVRVAEAAAIDEAAALLRQGQLVAFPTETVYGLGADAENGAAVAAIFEAKSRPRFNPLISHFPEAGAAFGQVAPTPLARRLAEAFWPGALTLVLPRASHCTISDLACAGLATAARGRQVIPAFRVGAIGVVNPITAASATRRSRFMLARFTFGARRASGRHPATFRRVPDRGTQQCIEALDGHGLGQLALVRGRGGFVKQGNQLVHIRQRVHVQVEQVHVITVDEQFQLLR